MQSRNPSVSNGRDIEDFDCNIGEDFDIYIQLTATASPPSGSSSFDVEMKVDT